MRPLNELILDGTHPVTPGEAGMQTRVTLRHGAKGTRKLVQKFGDQLRCVRYRYDHLEQVRYKRPMPVETLLYGYRLRAASKEVYHGGYF
jgi:hypothetical protein